MIEDIYKYKDRVYIFLKNSPTNKTYIIDKICKEENKEVFVETVKEYIETVKKSGWKFSNDYTKIIKEKPFEIPLNKKQ